MAAHQPPALLATRDTVSGRTPEAGSSGHQTAGRRGRVPCSALGGASPSTSEKPLQPGLGMHRGSHGSREPPTWPTALKHRAPPSLQDLSDKSRYRSADLANLTQGTESQVRNKSWSPWKNTHRGLLGGTGRTHLHQLRACSVPGRRLTQDPRLLSLGLCQHKNTRSRESETWAPSSTKGRHSSVLLPATAPVRLQAQQQEARTLWTPATQVSGF